VNIADAEVHYFLCIISILRCMWPPPHRAATATSKRRLLYHAKICRKKWCKIPVKANNRIKRHKNVQNSIHSFIHLFIKTLGHGSYVPLRPVILHSAAFRAFLVSIQLQQSVI